MAVYDLNTMCRVSSQKYKFLYTEIKFCSSGSSLSVVSSNTIRPRYFKILLYVSANVKKRKRIKQTLHLSTDVIQHKKADRLFFLHCYKVTDGTDGSGV